MTQNSREQKKNKTTTTTTTTKKTNKNRNKRTRKLIDAVCEAVFYGGLSCVLYTTKEPFFLRRTDDELRCISELIILSFGISFGIFWRYHGMCRGSVNGSDALYIIII